MRKKRVVQAGAGIGLCDALCRNGEEVGDIRAGQERERATSGVMYDEDDIKAYGARSRKNMGHWERQCGAHWSGATYGSGGHSL
jgi:hypothetical protein